MPTLDAPPSDDRLRYPVGRFAAPAAVTPADRERWIASIATLPERLRGAAASLDEARLDTPYRPGGWTVREVLHHVPDSHLNAYVRFKLALTEDAPTIKPYAESAWAALPDSRLVPVEVSLRLLEALHGRWVALLRAMTPEQYQRTYVHPEHGRTFTLDVALAMYAWHSEHHLGHVRIVAG